MRADTSPTGADGAAKNREADPQPGSKRKSGANEDVDLSSIRLPGEDDDALDIDENCDQVRRKITSSTPAP